MNPQETSDSLVTSGGSDIVLYHYWRSSAAYRVRIALNLKGLSYQLLPVHLVKDGGEQHMQAFRSINPQGLVPVLVHKGRVISQSMAICEYLDEEFDTYPLLTGDAVQRAQTRSMTLAIACDVHPLNNLRVLQYLKTGVASDIDQTAWMHHWMDLGFSSLEQQLDQLLSENGCLNERPGLFECFLVPQVYNAERFELDMSKYPLISRLTERCRALPEFIRAAPENQPDAT